MFNNNTFLKVISLIIAVLLWIYVMGEVNPETRAKISNIEVNFINTDALAEDGLAVVHEKNITVSAVIKGKRSEVNYTKNGGAVATVDVADCHKGKNTRDINLLLPDGIKLESVSDEELSFNVEERTEKEVNVSVEFLGEKKTSGSTPWVIAAKPDTVTVSGAESSVEKVECVRGTLAGDNASGVPKTVSVSVVPVDKDDNEILGIYTDTDSVKAEIQMMSIKSEALNVSAENVPDGYVVDKIDAPDTIKIVGSGDALDDVDEISGTVDLNETGAGESHVSIKLVLPEGCYLLNDENVPAARVVLKAADNK